MEKRKPHHGLAAFKASMSTVDKLHMTGAAQKDAQAIGYGLSDVVAALQSLDRKHFYKSMTSYGNNRKWQDVYHPPWDGVTLYVKFTDDAVTEFQVLSFKEK